MSNLCESQAELGDIARIAEVCFVSSFIFVMYSLYGICVNIKLNIWPYFKHS